MLRRVLFLMALSTVVSAAWGDPQALVPGEGDGTVWKPETVEVSVLRVQERQRLLVEVRPVLGALGWSLEWAPESQTMAARQGERRVSMVVNAAVAAVDGKQVKMPSPPRMLWDKLYVPLRFAAEVTGCTAEYLGDAVRLTRPDGGIVLVHLLG